MVNHPAGKAVGIPRLLLNVPINKILSQLKTAGFIKANKTTILPKGHTPIVNLSHYEILSFYNAKVRGLLNFYSFASNFYRLNSILWLLKASCALTLTRKYKLRTMSKVFRKFGP